MSFIDRADADRQSCWRGTDHLATEGVTHIRGLYGDYPFLDAGDPSTLDDFAACVYDGMYNDVFQLELTNVLVEVEVAHGPAWHVSGDGWMFRGSKTETSGVSKVRLRGNMLSFAAGGENLDLPAAEETDRYFALDDSMLGRTLMFGLVNDNGYCVLNTIFHDGQAQTNSATEFVILEPKTD